MNPVAARIGSEAAARDFEKWPVNSVSFSGSTESTWDGQLTDIKTWLNDRANWLDTQF